METITTDVLVVGAGPAGLTLSGLLARHGVDALTVTKYPGTANSPRAHITNQRTMEVFRDLGMETAVVNAAVPNEMMGNNVWATSFAGREIARLHSWGMGPERHGDYEMASPSSMCNIPQHRLEPLQLARAQELGARIRFDTELVFVSQETDRVTAEVVQRHTGERARIRSRYVVGADGGRSTVADQLGFVLDGTMGLGAAANVWLEADLTRYTTYRPSSLYWMNQPGNDYWVGSGTWICVTPWTEWVLLFMYDPADGEPDLSHEALLKRARTTIGDDSVDIRIKAVSTWQINHVVADEYCLGRAFLMGDAAHRHPPANGLGTNTSIQDAFNLGWKLVAVLKGYAGEGLLDTYDTERQPVGRQVVDRAMKSVADMLPISQALGFSPGQSAEDGWASLDALRDPGPEADARRAALRAAVQLQNYQFNAHGVELDQRYTGTAVVDDGTPVPEPTSDPELYHHSSTRPGSRLPHAWLERDRTPVSTLDLAGHGRFTVLTGHGGAPWLDAAEAVAAELGVPLEAELIAQDEDPLGQWATRREIGEDGALLVRPDHHIAWRSMGLVDDPTTALREALTTVLSRSD